MMKLSALVLASSLVLFSACKKKDDAGKADEPSAVAKTADPAAPAAPAPTPAAPGAPGAAMPAAGAPAAAPAAGGKTFATFDDYDAAASKAAADTTALFVADGVDCTKLAADLTKYTTDNKDLMAQGKAYEAANPDAEKQSEDKHADQLKQLTAKVLPSIAACQTDTGFKAAMAALQ